ncbi:LCP family protein [Streptomyces aidingensis]|uniref:Cell envelope-related function transcriptional attenuator common domain-containing protein n=1 Tax=Streptomyces aidingensis TaxID=910347 RepID=A0A1I1GIL7_9ACTN|nr:LCP family protein [Streptomyces aidingensis]SFC11637.1 cell envelope-related function transcriptional attenuator common domain-containing protein [Streptomyces aidingensis]
MPAPASRPRPPRGRAPRPAPRPRWGLRLATTAAALVLITGGVGHAMVRGVEDSVRRVDPFSGLDDRPEGGAGLNILLIGSDSREGIPVEDLAKYHLGRVSCNCADTIMLVHLSADGKRASVISLPRDSRAELPAHEFAPTGERHEAHPDKLNAALSHGGPQLMVRTVEDMTGLRVDHYVEVNFVSFMRTVDELGGVEVCTVRALKDDKTGLDLSPGTSTLNGGEALQYVRSRNVDASADFGRMQRQQRFVAALIDKAVSAEVLLDPGKLRRTAEVLLDSVRVDPGFGAEEMIELVRALHGFGPSSAEFTTVPIGEIGDSALAWEQPAADRLFRALREDRPLAPRPAGQENGQKTEDGGEPPGESDGSGGSGGDGGDGGDGGPSGVVPVDIPPGGIRVRVENASARAELGKQVAEELTETGFAAADASGGERAAGRLQTHTVITHDPARRGEALTLQAALPGARLREAEGQGRELTVTLGEQHERVQPVRDARTPIDSGAWQGGGYAAATGDQISCP